MKEESWKTNTEPEDFDFNKFICNLPMPSDKSLLEYTKLLRLHQVKLLSKVQVNIYKHIYINVSPSESIKQYFDRTVEKGNFYLKYHSLKLHSLENWPWKLE